MPDHSTAVARWAVLTSSLIISGLLVDVIVAAGASAIACEGLSDLVGQARREAVNAALIDYRLLMAGEHAAGVAAAALAGMGVSVHFGARLYNPATTRWTTMDPLGGGLSQNYTYAGGNPISNVDPSGLDFLGIGGAVSSVYKFVTSNKWVKCGLSLAGFATGFGLEIRDTEELVTLVREGKDATKFLKGLQGVKSGAQITAILGGIKELLGCGGV